MQDMSASALCALKAYRHMHGQHTLHSHTPPPPETPKYKLPHCCPSRPSKPVLRNQWLLHMHANPGPAETPTAPTRARTRDHPATHLFVPLEVGREREVHLEQRARDRLHVRRQLQARELVHEAVQCLAVLGRADELTQLLLVKLVGGWGWLVG